MGGLPSFKKRSWGGVGKKLLCAVTSATLALSLAPAAAFADAGAVDGGDGGWYTLPTSPISEFKHTAKDNNGNDYTYSYLSSGIWRVVGGFSQSMYYLMGINGVNFDRGLRNNTPWKSVSNGRLNTSHVTAVDGIMGTDVNTNPDEYLWNSCYNLNQSDFQAAADLAAYTAKENVIGDSVTAPGVWINANTGSTTWETVQVEVDGATQNIPVIIYREANFISDSDKFNDAVAWANGADTIKEYVEIERKRAGGSSDYDPYIGSWETASGGIHYGAELMYKLAEAVDEATEESCDENGNFTLMSRYVDANRTGKDDTAYSTAKALAQKYEDFAKATQYYMIDKVNSGTEKKVAAVVCGYNKATGENEEDSYAVRLFDTKTDEHENSSYGGRLVNSIRNFTTDVNTVLQAENVAVAFEPQTKANVWTSNTDDTIVEKTVSDETYVRWYHVSDIVKYADAVFVTDCPYGNTINNYLATDLNNRQTSIYSVDNNSYPSENENVNPLVNAADAQGAKASVYYKYPRHLFGVWYAQGFENCWMAPLAAAYMYPDVFTDPENVMAYAARNFWHIKTADLNGVLQATCNDISVGKGKTFGTYSNDYQAKLETIMKQGNAYYLQNTAAVNALNYGDLETHDLASLSADGSRVASDYVQSFTVKFDSNGGSSVSSQTVASGSTATAPANPTRSGYTFDGWYNGSAKYDFSTPVTSALTLTAHWTAVQSSDTKTDTKTNTNTATDTKTTTTDTTKTATATSTDTAAAEGVATGTTTAAVSGETVKATSSTEVAYVAPKSKSAKKVTVPATVTVNGKTYKVTSISANAFKGSKATSITVGKNVKTISAKAFNGATKLKTVSLGKGVTTLKKNAFKGASKLTKVTISSKKLTTKKSLANAFKGSKVKTVVLKGMNAKQKKAVKNAIVKYGGKKGITVK